MIRSVYVTDDPDRGWNEIAPYLLHYMRAYAAMSPSADSKSLMHGITTIEQVKETGLINVVTPEDAIKIGMEGPIGLNPLIGGLLPELGWKSLEMFVDKVLPHIKNAPQEWFARQQLADQGA
jgi:hypothetical protein